MSEERTGRDDCYICSRGHPDILETHHIVPSRFGGSDNDANLVDLCPSCHEALEKIYDRRFWMKVGAISREEQMNVMVDDLDNRLEQLEMDLSMAVREYRELLDDEYRDTGYEEMRKEALGRLRVASDGDEEDDTDGKELTKVVKSKVRREQSREYEHLPGVPKEELVADFAEKDVEPERTEAIIQRLRDLGELYRPREGYLRVV